MKQEAGVEHVVDDAPGNGSPTSLRGSVGYVDDGPRGAPVIDGSAPGPRLLVATGTGVG